MIDAIMDVVEQAAAWAWNASWHAAAVVGLVLVVRQLAGRRLAPGWRCALWGLVAMRLVMPQAPQHEWSVFNAVGATPISRVYDGPSAGPHARVTVGYGAAPLAIEGVIVSASPPAPVAAPRVPILPLLWITGAVLLFARTMVGRIRLRRRLAAAVDVDDPAVRAVLECCRTRMGVRRAVRLLATDAVSGPALCGLWQPAILLPSGLVDRLDARQLSFVFLHELAHVRRADVLAEWAIAAITAMHWFNPLVWLAARLYRADRELARDAMVLRATAMTAGEPHAYGDTLLRLIEAFPPRRAAINLLGMLSGRRALAERIRSITSFDPTPSRAGALLGLFLLVAIGCVTLTDRKRSGDTGVAGGGSGVGPATTAAVPASADDASGPPGESITRVYDVRDLITPVNDHVPDEPSPRGMSKPQPSPTTRKATAAPDVPIPPATREGNLEAVVSLIRETVEPASWGAAASGTAPATIRELSGQLVVAQTRRAHGEIGRLLDQLRETRAIQILVEARFVLLDPTPLPKDDPAFAPVFALDPAAAAAKPGVVAYLTAAQTATLVKAVETQPGATTLSAPRVTTFNGQRAYVRIGTSRAYVGDLTVVRDAAGRFKSYEPEIATTEWGLLLDVQGTASQDRKQVTLTLRPRISKLLKIHTRPFANVPADHPAGLEKPTVQQPEINSTEVRTTATVPVGQTLVLGGIEDTAGLQNLDDRNVKPKAGQRLYIMVTPRVLVGATTRATRGP